MALICDTGPLYAAADRDDEAHSICAALLEDWGERIVVPSPVVVEFDWLVSRRLGEHAFDAFLSDIEEGSILIADLVMDDYRRVRQLCQQYADLPLGFVDAAVIAVAERAGERKIATLDHRHFGVVRPKHIPSFALLPA